MLCNAVIFSGGQGHSASWRSVPFLVIEVERCDPKVCSEYRACGSCTLVQHESMYYFMLLEEVNNF